MGSAHGASPRRGGGNRPPRRMIGLPGPRHAQHTVTVEELALFNVPVNDDGVVIGATSDGLPAVLGLFRRSAHHLVCIGGTYVPQLLALRAAATGARVAVETARGSAWASLAQAAGGGQQCITVHTLGRMGPQGASVQSPVLVIRDCGALPPPSQLGQAPWLTTLTLLPYLEDEAVEMVSTADVVCLQRLNSQEIEKLSGPLALSYGEEHGLRDQPDDVTFWVGDETHQRVRLQPSQIELGMLGQPRRHD